MKDKYKTYAALFFGATSLIQVADNFRYNRFDELPFGIGKLACPREFKSGLVQDYDSAIQKAKQSYIHALHFAHDYFFGKTFEDAGLMFEAEAIKFTPDDIPADVLPIVHGLRDNLIAMRPVFKRRYADFIESRRREYERLESIHNTN